MEKESFQIRPARSGDLEHISSIELAAAKRFPLDRIPNPDETTPHEELIGLLADGLLWVAEG